MKATVFHKPHDIRVDTVPDPIIKEPDDIIVQVTSTAICGSDLHIYSGAVPQKESMIMGHEFMGIVADTGKTVTSLRKGDRIVIPFPIACGQCFFCQHGSSPNCENSNHLHYGPDGDLMDQKGGALFGYTDLYGGYSGHEFAGYIQSYKRHVRYGHISHNIISHYR